MLHRIVSLALVIFSASLPLLAQAQQPQPQTASYQTLLERVKKSDPTVDFLALRMAYTETPNYDPYGGDSDARKAMFAALNAKDYTKALKLAEATLERNYVDLNGHYISFAAHKELKNEKQAEFHRYVLQGLLKSIMGKGDGKSPAGAFVVIDTDEEYALLGIHGFQVTGQALVHQDGHSYDKMSVVDLETKEAAEYYFNIDKPFNWLAGKLKK